MSNTKVWKGDIMLDSKTRAKLIKLKKDELIELLIEITNTNKSVQTYIFNKLNNKKISDSKIDRFAEKLYTESIKFSEAHRIFNEFYFLIKNDVKLMDLTMDFMDYIFQIKEYYRADYNEELENCIVDVFEKACELANKVKNIKNATILYDKIFNDDYDDDLRCYLLDLFYNNFDYEEDTEEAVIRI